MPSGKGISMERDYYNADNTFSYRRFVIYNCRERKDFYAIEFEIPNFPTMINGTYIWGDNLYENEIIVKVYYLNNTTKEHQFYMSNNLPGNLVVSKNDSASHIFSGIFNGKLKSIDGTKEIEITNGRFDLNLATVNNHYVP